MNEPPAVSALRTYTDAPAMEAPSAGADVAGYDLQYVERRTLLKRIAELEEEVGKVRFLLSMERTKVEDMRQQRDDRSETIAYLRSGGPSVPLPTINACISTMTLAAGALIGRSQLARRKLFECITVLSTFTEPK